MTVASEDLQLSGVRTLPQVLARTPNGTDAVELAKRLGLWTGAAHEEIRPRRRFPANLADLTPPQLSNEVAHWTADFGRLTELVGALGGQRNQLRIRAKAVRAEARSKIRRRYADAAAADKAAKMPTASAVTDEAEEDPAVIDVEERLSVVELLLEQTQAAKEATAQFLATLSREISFRGDQMRGRIYG